MGVSGGFWNSAGGPAVALAALCAVAVAVVMLRRWQFRSGLMRTFTRDDRALLREQREVEKSLRQTMAELERAAAAACDRVERQISRLQTLARQIDRPTENRKEQPFCADSPEQKHNVEQPPPAAFLPRTARKRVRREPPISAPNGYVASAPIRPLDPRAQRVFELASAGAAPIDIAGQTGMILGEVELLLGLHAMAPCDLKDSTHNPTPAQIPPSEPKSLA